MDRRSLILDMDVGIDDAIAIAYLATRTDAEIVAIASVHGNVEAPLAAENALRVLETCGLDDVPVAVGAWRPLAQPLATAAWVHGEDGLGNTWQPAPRGHVSGEHGVDQLIRLAHERPGELDLVATGPLTNLGAALVMDRELPSLIRSVVVMGGAVHGIGNASPTAEANIVHDPEAAQLVFAAGWPVTMVGLDVTMETRLEPDDLDRLGAATTPHGRLVAAILDHYVDVYARAFGRRTCPLHDPLAAGIALDPALVTGSLEAEVRVELLGGTRGMTIVDRRPWYRPPAAAASIVHVATEVDSRRFVDDLVGRLVAPLPGH